MAPHTKPPRSGVRILIAEDSPTQAKQLRHILEQRGYEVAVASNGRQALEMAPQFKPSLIISDIVMPEMNGYELCRAIKANEKLKRIPLTLVTTLSDSQDVLRGLECGADNFIRKPYKARQLLERIHYLLLNLELRKTQRMRVGIEIELGGHKHFITAERQQILDILISTYEEAVAIKNELQLREEELATFNQVLQGLYRIAEGLNGVVGEREVAEIALERVLELPGIAAGWISVQEAVGEFRFVAARNLSPELIVEVARPGTCECRRRFLAGNLDRASNILDCEHLKGATGEACGLRHHASVPLWLPNGRALGLMNLAKLGAGQFSETELKLLHGVGHQVAVALERAQLNQDLEHLVQERTAKLVAESARREQVEVELRQLNEDLEALVAARTSDLEQANVALANREEEIRSVVDHMVDCVITIDEMGFIRSANAAVEKVFGYTIDEVVGKNVSLLMPDPHRAAHDGYIARYCRTGQAKILGVGRELEGVHKNGHSLPLDLSISEYSVHGQRFFTGILRDIRERVRIMTALEQARREAEQANQAKSAFLAAMSHEIRTPMNGVIGMIDVLHQTSLKGHQVEMVNLIQESAYSLLGIIDDILDFSKIEAGKLDIERAPIVLEEVLEKTCGMLDRLAEKKGVDLTLFLDPALPTVVLGDALRLRQILVNLVGNAIKFSAGRPRQGRVSVRISQVDQASDPVSVVFQVADNGIGMDEATRAGLFSPFTQADASTTRRFGGTGLGLAITQQLVALMGGDIAVQSAPDAGSTFTVRLAFEPLPPAGASEEESLVAGLSCLVVGGPEGQAADLALYLEAGRARVERVPDLEATRAGAEKLGPGVVVVVIDEGRAAPPPDELRAAGPATDTRFVLIGRGPQRRRRRPRKEGSNRVLVDGNLLTRRTLFAAVALAAGRVTDVEEAEPPARRETNHRAPSRDEALAKGRLILLAEDNETNQKVILQQLALLGYAADVAEDGIEALEHWRSGDYALLLTDLHMPKLDGYGLAAAIRAEEQGSQRCPIIVLTANALKGEAERCRAAGMDAYLTKPMPLEDLRTTLERWLPTPAPEVRPAVDVGVLKDLVGDEADVIVDFLQDFRVGAAQIAAQIGVACQRGQAEQAGALAHKLKSSARSVGALDLGELCEELERAGKGGQVEALTQLWPRFEAEMARVDEFLGALEHRNGGDGGATW